MLKTRFTLATIAVLALLGVLAIPATAGAQCVQPPEGIVSWWSGDGCTRDYIGNNHGEIVGEVVYSPGVVGKAFAFGYDGGYVLVPDDSTLDMPEAFSIEFWRTIYDTDAAVISKRIANCSGGTNYEVTATPRSSVGITLSDPQSWDPNEPYECFKGFSTWLGNIDVHAFHHIVVTLQPEGPSQVLVTFYLNGNVRTSGYITADMARAVNNAPVMIGASYLDASGQAIGMYRGRIDELTLYNRALTAAEVHTLYDAGSDGKCKPATPDADGDDNLDFCDNCPDVSNTDQQDSDWDGIGDACDSCPLDSGNDVDRDGVCAPADNCWFVYNPDQKDTDDDGRGDACDNCPDVSSPPENPLWDSDADGMGDVCDPCPSDPLNDADGDGVCGDQDNCPTVSNSDQVDDDWDGIGDLCDPCLNDGYNESDGDGICFAYDNCPGAHNPDQADSDGDGIGDACKPGCLAPFEVRFDYPGSTPERSAFGFRVALSGDTAIVNDPFGTESQAAIYVLGADGNWSLLQRLSRWPSGIEYSSFAGDTLAILAAHERMHIYERGADQLFAEKQFSRVDCLIKIALDENTLVGVSDECGGFSDLLMSWDRSTGDWAFEGRIRLPEQSFVGAGIALSGDTLLLGTGGMQMESAGGGTVLVYGHSGNTWALQATLAPAEGSVGYGFGSSVALSGDTAVVGAIVADVGGWVDRGAAYVFERSGSQWTETQRLVASDGRGSEYFGHSIAMEADTIVVGAPAANRGDGAAYVFKRNASGVWEERWILKPQPGDQGFGGSVSISQGRVLVGSYCQDPIYNIFFSCHEPVPLGAAYVFNLAVAEADADGDGISDGCDNCRGMNNPDQKDTDADGIGDLCDPVLQYWAVAASASSAWGADRGEWSAYSAVGLPDTYECYDLPTAWCPSQDGEAPEWLEVYFKTPSAASGVVVYETYMAPFVTKIELLDTDNVYHTVWEGTDNADCPGQLTVTFPRTEYLVAGARIHTQAEGWEEIDAVELIVDRKPVAEAGPGQAVHTGSTVMLDGSGSSDVDGDLLTYQWTLSQKPAGSQAVLSDATIANPTFDVDVPGDYAVDLVVADAFGLSSDVDTVLVSTTNTAPVADAGPDQAVTLLDTTVYLDGNPSYDPDGDGDDIAYAWSFVSKPAGSAASLTAPMGPTPSFTPDVYGAYVVQLTVSDSWVAGEPDLVTVSFSNLPPVANAGLSQSAVVGNTVTLNGNQSDDPNGDALTYLWAFVSRPDGSGAAIQDPTAPVTSFVPDVGGTYVVQLMVNDGQLGSAPVTTQIEAVVQLSSVSYTVQEAQTVIPEIDLTAFKNESMANTMLNMLNAAMANVEAGHLNAVLNQLQKGLLTKTDGCAKTGEPDNNDWITDCNSQELLYDQILLAIEMVQELM